MPPKVQKIRGKCKQLKILEKKYAKLFASLENSFVYLQSVFAPLQTRNRSKILNRKRYAFLDCGNVRNFQTI